ncbi:hypothetical protein LSH36_21g01008 [Paralvinella palmiformis]|uniref:ZP domain-containing protein n=1 Tax=Paralvinella palmiformis TaxID=53620 RepID=A0AAD9KBD1_9ANNE|nr:hypothetical protein LSH36_21g01008 [Paralvinella palmiformis]
MQITLILLYLGAGLGTASYNAEFTIRHDCYINLGFTSPYITALQHQMSAISGCVTNQTTPISDKEVHLITIASRRHSNMGQRERSRNRPQSRHSETKTLHIEPRAGVSLHDRPVIIMLWSADPIVWMLSTKNINNSSRYLIVLPKHSRLRNDARLSIHTKVKKYNSTLVPSQLVNLIAWTRSKYDALTSTNSLPYTDVVQLRVGIDPRASTECHLSESTPNGITLPAQAVVWQKENTSACAAKWNEGYDGKDVHIIEVHNIPDVAVPGSRVGHIRLVVTSEKMPPPVKHIDLVLKAPPGASWTVDISKFKGNLRIITNAEDIRNEGSVRQTVSITSETLTETGQNLVNWVADSYGHPVSYTEANTGDKFILYVDGGIKLPYTINGIGSPYRQPAASITPGWPSTKHLSQHIIQQLKSVSCTDWGMSVALPKLMLKNQGIEREYISLLDQSCRARDNSTHLILSTSYGQCGTRQTDQGNMAIYANMIVVRLPSANNIRQQSNNQYHSAGDPGTAMNDDQESSGSGIGSEMMADDTFMDDEDLHDLSKPDTLSISVKCEIPSYKTISNAPIRTFVPSYDYDLYLYSDKEYKHRLGASEKSPPRFQEGNTVYIEAASLTSDPTLRPMLKSCVVSPGTLPTVNSHKLIEKGCVLDNNNLVLMEAGPKQEQRFSLKVLDYWQNNMGSLFHVVCELAMCTESEKHTDVPMCVNQGQYCFLNNMGSDNPDPAAMAKTKFVSSPALLVIKPLLPGHDLPHMSAGQSTPPVDADAGPTAAVLSSEGSSDKCERVVRVEGLDSGTVVGIAFAAFVIGVLLTAALWYIHTHTGPLSRRNSRPRSAETSGESTPSSTAPITIHQIHRFNPPMAVHLLSLSPRQHHCLSSVHHLVLLPLLDRHYDNF